MIEMITIALIVFIAILLIYKDSRIARNVNSESKIWYDDKYVMSRFKNTLVKSRLSSLGSFETIVLEKATIKPQKKSVYTYVLFIETVNKKHSGMIDVSIEEYDKYKVGDSYGKKAILANQRNPEFTIMTDKEDPNDAINSVVSKARWLGLALIIISLLISFSILSFIIPLLKVL